MKPSSNSEFPKTDFNPTPSSRGIDLSKYYAAARERMWIFLVVAISVASIVLAVIASLDPLYKAETTIQLLRQEEKQLQFAEVTEETLETSEDLNTEVGFYESDQILARIASRIEAEIYDDFIAPYEIPEGEKTLEGIMSIVEEHRNVIPSRLSLVVVIEYLHQDPEVAARVANFFHEEISAAHSERRSEIMDRAIVELRDQAEIQRLKVENLERDIHAFKNSQKTISFDQGLDIDRQEISILNANATNAKEALDRLYAKWSMVERKTERGESLLELSFLTDNPNIRELVATISNLRIQMAELEQRYREFHPKMIQASESLQAAETELANAMDTQVEMLKAELRQGERNYHASLAKVNQKKQQILDLQGMQATYDSKMRDLEVNKRLYLQFFSRIQEIEAQNRGQTSRIRIVDEARVPRELAQPNLRTGALLAFMAGGVSGTFVLIVLVFLDNRVKCRSDIERRLGQPIIGMLSVAENADSNLHKMVRENSRDPRVSENLNNIIDSIRLDQSTSDAKSILVTSTSHGEGKSYVASSIAAAFERYGDKTLLLNCDLRSNQAAVLEHARSGLVHYLQDRSANIEDSIYKSPTLDCDVMPAGAPNAHPYRLFESERFESLMAELRNRYDRIVIDTPPTHLYGDARNVSQHADGQLIVIGFGIPKMDNAQKSISKLSKLGKPIFGAVVNGISKKKAKIYYPEFYDDQKSYANDSKNRGVGLGSIFSRIKNSLGKDRSPQI
ncbi:GumC family protein [Pelagicoccus albus]|uniref:non-specific protein-tyrosine kinase n=1 Tax=Pelagicoccus albus TaxID=415222 RepID=A0A7X1E9Z1_9BACT|nr:polysaccharide biosynthesis tyrosine autokinase [Pelagicoccus albus]MBC2606262.1 polysaccharide biosynthesis tyrosine autokinase [Pelagicoccus albus]